MTDQTNATWHVAEDPTTGEPVLWHGDRAVLRHSDLRRVTWPEYGDRLFDVLTAVLAPDEATVERLALSMHSYALVLDDPEQMRWCVEEILARLAGTSAQARHTADNATGCGEDG